VNSCKEKAKTKLFPKDSVSELNTKKLGNSPNFLTITRMTLSAKQFRSYIILTIDATAEFCFWTEQQQNGSSCPEYRFGIQLSRLSDGLLDSSKWLAICKLWQSKSRPVAESAFLGRLHHPLKIRFFATFRHDLCWRSLSQTE
jgi:hypothetical protein